MSLTSLRQSFKRFGSITAIAKNGEKHTLAFQDDQNLFDLLTSNGLLSETGTCMGNIACGRCKVKVVEGKPPSPEDEEKEILGDAPPQLRLSCAISLSRNMNGAVFQIA